MRDLVIVAERVFNKRGLQKRKKLSGQKQQTTGPSKSLLAVKEKPEDCRRCLKQIASEEGGKGACPALFFSPARTHAGH